MTGSVEELVNSTLDQLVKDVARIQAQCRTTVRRKELVLLWANWAKGATDVRNGWVQQIPEDGWDSTQYWPHVAHVLAIDLVIEGVVAMASFSQAVNDGLDDSGGGNPVGVPSNG